MPFLQKYLTNFQKLFWLKEKERGHSDWKFEAHRHFSFAIATLQLFPHPENVKISIFPFTLSRQKCHIFRSIKRIFKTFFVAERWGTWLLWLKISSAQIFWFWKSNVRTFPTSRKFKNFNLFLYIVPAEMLYLQKYLTNFQKLFFCSKMRKLAIVVENFKCTDILVLQEQRYRFSNIQKM